MENMLGSQVSYTDTLNVAACQTVLNKVLNLNPPLNVDGIAGPKTRAAVIEFQKKHGLSVDGIIGPQTSRALQWSNSSMSNTQYSLNNESSWINEFAEEMVMFFDDFFDNLTQFTNFPIYKLFNFFLQSTEKKNRKVFSYAYKKICNTKKVAISNTVAILENKKTTMSKEELKVIEEKNDADNIRNHTKRHRIKKNCEKELNKLERQRYQKYNNEIEIVKAPLKQMESNSAFLKKIQKKIVTTLIKISKSPIKLLGPISNKINLISPFAPAISYIMKQKWIEAFYAAINAFMEIFKDFLAIKAGYAAAGATMAVIAAGGISILSSPGMVAIITAMAVGVCVYFIVKWLLDLAHKNIEVFVKSSYEKHELEIEVNRELYSCLGEGCVCKIPSI